MIRILVVTCFFLCTRLVEGQINEVGVFLGGSNFVGDIGKENYINPNDFAFGVLYKWNKSTRHAWRFSLAHANLKIDDAKSDSSARNQRNYALKNSVTELSVGLEFNFFDFDLHNLGFKITPYLYTGLNYFWYDSKYFVNKIAQKEDKKGSNVSIPMTLGIKFNLDERWILGLESGVRYTFVDDIDGSKPKNKNYKHLQFGNINSNDWYVFTGFTLTYTFGKNPCFCSI